MHFLSEQGTFSYQNYDLAKYLFFLFFVKALSVDVIIHLFCLTTSVMMSKELQHGNNKIKRNFVVVFFP